LAVTQNKETLVPGEALIYERGMNGIIYARYRDPPHNSLPRWIVGGAPESFYPNTSMPRPDNWPNVQDVNPDYTLMHKHPELQEKYREFLELQVKYQAWEKVVGQR